MGVERYHDPLSALEVRIKDIIETNKDGLSSGSCKGFPEYTRVVGRVEGLKVCLAEIRDLRKQLETS